MTSVWPVSNTPKGRAIDLQREMVIFDSLPLSLRTTLSESTKNYSSEDILREWCRSGLTDLEFIRKHLR